MFPAGEQMARAVSERSPPKGKHDVDRWRELGACDMCHVARGLSYCSSAPPDLGHPDPQQPWVSRCRVATSGFQNSL